jgi:8-oxo-dGTP pyrophosphatase MutT (NUDIX family)
MPHDYNRSVESPVSLLDTPDVFIRRLKEALARPLPGVAAQNDMAPLLRQPGPQPTDHPRQSAVLELLHLSPAGMSLIFTARPEHLKHHGGQISFPGGGAEEVDATYMDTALREAEEELGIETQRVVILGKLTPLFIAPSHNLVHPYVGWLPHLPPLHPDPVEVDSVLTVPLTQLLDPDTIGTYAWRRNGQGLTAPAYCVGQAAIWGATAMMLSELLVVIRRLLSDTSS